MVSPELHEDLARDGDDDADIEDIDARELFGAGGIRQFLLHEFFSQVLRPHQDAVGDQAQREEVDKYPAIIGHEYVRCAHHDEDHHPDGHGA